MSIAHKTTTVNVYLNFPGTCEEAFTFYKGIFGGEFSNLSLYNEVPSNINWNLPTNWNTKVMHVALPISAETFLLGSDSVESLNGNFIPGNNFSISINPTTLVEATHLFESLSVNGTIVTPLAETFWGATFGVVTDQWGINWTINFVHTTEHAHVAPVVDALV